MNLVYRILGQFPVLRRWKQDELKKTIRLRLRTEDYTCRLPDKGWPYPPKPHIRYRLTTQAVNTYLLKKGLVRRTAFPWADRSKPQPQTIVWM